MPILMCRPDFFDVQYDINPWMINQIGNVNHPKAVKQWNNLFNEITKHSVVYLVESNSQVPDLVFTANAGVVVKNTAVLSRFKYPQRRQEEPVYQSWFESKGYQVVQPRHYFEGAGDLLDDSQGRYWLGSGFRTDAAVKPELEMILQQEVNLLELVYPHWYHLDTCFCPLSNGELLWYPKAFSESSQRLIRNSFDRSVEVDDQDAESFACNAVCIGREIFMSLAPTTQEKLNILGYNTTAFELSEFQKSGGSAKCLTLRFD